MSKQFNALVVDDQSGFSCQTQPVGFDFLTESEVLIEVEFSSLNYKDALAVTNKGKIVKQFPFIPGIDLAGIVVESKNESFKKGDRVIATGFGIGERYFGSYSQYVWAKSEWLTHLPDNISTEDAMFIGTAGFTAMLCVDALIENNTKPTGADVLVSGASGGVGSYAVIILSELGFNVSAMSTQNTDYLQRLGVKNILSTAQFSEKGKPLDSQKWAGAIDVVGGNILANILSQMNYGAAVAACGLAGGFKLETTVMPFILRGVKLIGIDSVYYPADQRAQVWQKLAKMMNAFNTSITKQFITLEELPAIAEFMLRGNINGRVLVRL